MKKIVILSLHLGYGGIEKSVVSLANALSKIENYQVEIVTVYRIYQEPAFSISNKVKVTYLLDPKYNPNKKEWLDALHNLEPINFFKQSVKSLKILYKRHNEVAKYLKNNPDIDVVISTRTFLNEWSAKYASSKTLKIGWEHNHHHNNMKYANAVVNSAKDLDYLVLVSKDLKQFYQKKMELYKCRCFYIPNALEEIPKKMSPLTSKRLITVGRLAKEKGYLDLLKIYKDLKSEGFDWGLDIIGDGKEKETLENYIKNNNLLDVTLHGFKNSKEIERLMSKASIYVMTSYTESFGIVLLEAMSNGLPCLAFDSAEGAREIITSGEDGYLIKHRNFKAMEKKIKDLADDLEKRKELGKSGRSKAKKYTMDSLTSFWENLIEKKG